MRNEKKFEIYRLLRSPHEMCIYCDLRNNQINIISAHFIQMLNIAPHFMNHHAMYYLPYMLSGKLVNIEHTYQD